MPEKDKNTLFKRIILENLNCKIKKDTYIKIKLC